MNQILEARKAKQSNPQQPTGSNRQGRGRGRGGNRGRGNNRGRGRGRGSSSGSVHHIEIEEDGTDPSSDSQPANTGQAEN